MISQAMNVSHAADQAASPLNYIPADHNYSCELVSRAPRYDIALQFNKWDYKNS